MSSKPQQKPFRIGSSPPEVFYNEEILKHLVKFMGKHLCRSLLFHKVTGCKKRIHKNLAKFTGKHLCQRLRLQVTDLKPFQKRDSSTGVFQ